MTDNLVQAFRDMQRQFEQLQEKTRRLEAEAANFHMAYRQQCDADTKQLETDNQRLKGLLLAASDDLENWGAYASEYFQQKHDLARSVARYRVAASKA